MQIHTEALEFVLLWGSEVHALFARSVSWQHGAHFQLDTGSVEKSYSALSCFSKLSTAQESLRRQACPISGRFKISPHVATVVTFETSNVGHQRIRLCSAPRGCKAQLMLRFLLGSQYNLPGWNEKCCELLLDFKANINEKSFARSSTQHPVQLYAAIWLYDMCMSLVIHSAWTAIE